MYCVPLPCGDRAFMVCELPGVHCSVCGVVIVVPSTTTCSPAGTVVNVIPCGAAVNAAVTFFGAFIVTLIGFVVPVASPPHELNCCPLPATPVNCTTVPAA